MFWNGSLFGAQTAWGAWASHLKNIMRECRGRHIYCWRLHNCIEIIIKYCISCWYCCHLGANSLGPHCAHLNGNINNILTLCSHRGATLAKPTQLAPLKVIGNILAKITRRAQMTKMLCANDARMMREGGVGRELTFPKFKDCLHGAPDACRLIIACKLPICEHMQKNTIRAPYGSRRVGQACGYQHSPQNRINQL